MMGIERMPRVTAFKPYLAVVFLLLLGAAWTWVNRVPEASTAPSSTVTAPHADFRAPPLNLSSTTGERVDLGALRGQVVLVNFWATWCPPCRAEMPAVDRLYSANRDAGLVVLAVNQQEDPGAVRAFAAQFNLSFPILLDPDGTVNARYNVTALPTSFFIDRKGIIRNVVIGPMTREQAQRALQPLLAEGGL